MAAHGAAPAGGKAGKPTGTTVDPKHIPDFLKPLFEMLKNIPFFDLNVLMSAGNPELRALAEKIATYIGKELPDWHWLFTKATERAVGMIAAWVEENAGKFSGVTKDLVKKSSDFLELLGSALITHGGAAAKGGKESFETRMAKFLNAVPERLAKAADIDLEKTRVEKEFGMMVSFEELLDAAIEKRAEREEAKRKVKRDERKAAFDATVTKCVAVAKKSMAQGAEAARKVWEADLPEVRAFNTGLRTWIAEERLLNASRKAAAIPPTPRPPTDFTWMGALEVLYVWRYPGMLARAFGRWFVS